MDVLTSVVKDASSAIAVAELFHNDGDFEVLKTATVTPPPKLLSIFHFQFVFKGGKRRILQTVTSLPESAAVRDASSAGIVPRERLSWIEYLKDGKAEKVHSNLTHGVLSVYLPDQSPAQPPDIRDYDMSFFEWSDVISKPTLPDQVISVKNLSDGLVHLEMYRSTVDWGIDHGFDPENDYAPVSMVSRVHGGLHKLVKYTQFHLTNGIPIPYLRSDIYMAS
jgi:hypothetical protein